MSTERFQVVALRGVRRWTDENGKRRQETKKFWQTINPFNKTTDGNCKTYHDIMAELKAEREAWLVAHTEGK